MEGRESRRANDIFFVCSLVDYIARKTKNRRSDVVEALGRRAVAQADAERLPRSSVTSSTLTAAFTNAA